MQPCKHLNYDAKRFPSCTLVVINDFDIPVKHWVRLDLDENPQNVQFCKKRGRIRGIFQCYNEGEMSCYEPEPPAQSTSRQTADGELSTTKPIP